MTSSTYEPGDRVWVSQPDDQPDWPAIVLGNEEAKELGLTLGEGLDVVVKYYFTDDYGLTVFSSLTPFEGSSAKAVTTDPSLREAIKLAMEDTNANPLKIIATSGSGGAGGVTAPQVSKHRSSTAESRPSKKSRTEAVGSGKAAGASSSSIRNDNNHHINGDDGDRRVPPTYHYEDVKTLLDIASMLTEANETSDIRAATKQLLRLDRVAVTYEQLRATKVGIAIGNLLDNEAMRAIWPLADQLARTLMTIALPRATLEALQFQRNESRSTVAGVEQARQTFAAAAGGSNNKSVDRIVEAFLKYDADAVSAKGAHFDVTDFVKSFFQALASADARTLFLTEVTKSSRTALRHQLLNGEMDAAKFSTLSPADLTTAEEIALEARRVRERMEAEDREKLADSVGTTMFPCPNCGKRNARFHEQQTRGADEPTTKFCNCLECKHHWTTE